MTSLVLTLSLASSLFANDLRECESRVKESPDDYDAARCFLEATNRQNQGEGRLARAREQTLKALDKLQKQRPDAQYLDITRANLFYDSDPEKATRIYQDAARRHTEIQNPVGAVIAHGNAAFCLFWNLNRPKDAQKEIEAIQRINERETDPETNARALALMAAYACDAGTSMGSALEILQGFSPRHLKASPYSLKREIFQSRSLCSMHHLDYAQAQADLRQLQEVARLQEDQKTLALAAYRMGYVAVHQLDTGSVTPAQGVERAISLLNNAVQIARQANQPEFVVRALAYLSVLVSRLPDDVDEAVQYAYACERAAQESKDPQLLAFCESSLAHVLRDRNPERAKTLALRALEKLPSLSQPAARIRTLREALRRVWAVSPPRAALAVAERAIHAMELDREAQRATVARQRIFASWTQDYYWISHRLLELSRSNPEYLEKSFEVIERSRARVLFEHMSSGLSDPRRGAAAKRQGLALLSELSKTHRVGKRDFVAGNSKSKEDPVVSLQTVQSQLAADEAMILYQTAAKQSYDGEDLGGAWALVVTQQKAHPVQLPTELAVLKNGVGVLRDLIRNDDPGVEEANRTLARLIFEPLQDQLPTQIQKLVIVPDGPLHALPFSAIASGYSYSIAPSATVWSQIRSTRRQTLPAQGISLVDPLRKDHSASSSNTERSADGPDSMKFGPLPASKREAKAIVKFLGRGVKVIQGPLATPKRLTQDWTEGDRLLHISAHSDVKIHAPDLSSLLLSNVDATGDGRLAVQEIVDMPAKDAVVVLAGCATGWGTLLAGEGMLSLGRAFQRAGATAVVASLWPIRDDLSADFFELFYKHLGRGESVANALELARENMKERGHAKSSYEGFVVLGDGSVSFAARSGFLQTLSKFAWPLGSGLLVLGVWSFVRRQRLRRTPPTDSP